MSDRDTVLASITKALQEAEAAGTPASIPADHMNVHPKVLAFLTMRKVDKFPVTTADLRAWNSVLYDARQDRHSLLALA